MRGKIIFAGLILGLSALAANVASAQDNVRVPGGGGATPADINCSGTVTSESVPKDTYVITGQNSNTQIVFIDGDLIYINKGSDQGAKVGDLFSITRPLVDTTEIEWTKWQNSILHKMGTVWEDEGQARIVVAQPKVSIAQIEHPCDFVQRGDTVLPYVQRPVPPLKQNVEFDKFAAPNGKALAMIIAGKKFREQVGTNDIVYVNLGNLQGVKIGDYFRVFRYEGTQHETAYNTPRFSFDLSYKNPTYGFGSSPAKWNWSNVPRENIGEGVVLRTGPNSSTVLITFTLGQIYAGDYVEVE
jgi:hypothetical protein